MQLEHDNLEEFHDPANYDLEEGAHTRLPAAFCAELALQTGGPVLDLACGSGLVTIPVAETGVAVTGVDLSAPMLAHARKKSAHLPVEWVEGDMRTVRLERSFRLVIITGNAFQAMINRSDQEALLATVAAHLEPEGLFVFGTRNPRRDDLVTTTAEEKWLIYTSVEGHIVSLSGTQEWEPIAQVMHWTSYRRWWQNGQEQCKVTRIATRYTFPQELLALLHYNGFAVQEQYGDWDRTPLTAASPSIISICRRR